MATLYEIRECFREWQKKIVEQEGELNDDDIKAFEVLDTLAEEKIEAYVIIIKELKAEQEMYATERKRLVEREERYAKTIKRMTSALDEFMQMQSKEKFSTPKAEVCYRSSKVVSIEDNVTLPAEYLRVKTEVDKIAIKEALQGGKVIQGCMMVERKNIQIK